MKNDVLIRIGMIAYTEYHGDARVKRYSEALINHGFLVDCYVLSESKKERIEKINGLSIIHFPIAQYRGNNTLAYLFSYLKFFLYAFKAVSIKNRNKYAVIHVHNMPDFLVFTSIFNKISGAKVILDIHDTMPELYRAKFNSAIGSTLYYILLFQEKLSSAFVDILINVHHPHSKHIIDNHGIDSSKTRVICNFADINHFNINRYKKLGINRVDQRFKLIYHGTIADRFGLDIILDGVKEAIISCPKIGFDIYGKGDGVDSLLMKIEKLSLGNNVKYHGQIDLDKIPEKIFFADLGIVSYKMNESTNLMLPLKLMEYIAMLTPVLTINNDAIKYYFNGGELEYYEADNSISFANKLTEIIMNPDKLKSIKNRIKNINNRFNWENEKIKYIEIVNKLALESSL